MDFILLSNKKHEIYNISKSLPVMTGSNADARNYTMSKENREVYNPWKSCWIIFSRLGDHSQKKLVFRNGIPRYLWTWSEFFTKQQIFKTSYTCILLSSCQKSYNSTEPSLRNDSNKKFREMMSLSAKTGSWHFNFRWKWHFLKLQRRLNKLMKTLYENEKV